ASNAFAIMVSSAIATGKRSWPDAANYWAWRLLWQPTRPRITETSMNNSPGHRCASVRSATVAAWSWLRCWRLTDRQQSGIPHEHNPRLREIAALAGLAPPALRGSPAFRCGGSHLATSIFLLSRPSTLWNRGHQPANPGNRPLPPNSFRHSGLRKPFNTHRGGRRPAV